MLSRYSGILEICWFAKLKQGCEYRFLLIFMRCCSKSKKLKMGTTLGSAAHNTVTCRRSAPHAKYTRTTTAFRQIHTHDGTHGEHQTNNRPSLDRPNSVVDLVAVPYLPRPDPASAHGFPGPPPSAPTKPACQS